MRPECVHNLLAVETGPGSQGEELDEVGRLPQAPGTLLYGPSPHGNLEATEQPDTYGLRLPTCLSTRVVHGAAVLLVVLFGGCLPLCVPSHPLSLHLPSGENQPPLVHTAVGCPTGSSRPLLVPYLPLRTWFKASTRFYEHTLYENTV